MCCCSGSQWLGLTCCWTRTLSSESCALLDERSVGTHSHHVLCGFFSPPSVYSVCSPQIPTVGVCVAAMSFPVILISFSFFHHCEVIRRRTLPPPPVVHQGVRRWVQVHYLASQALAFHCYICVHKVSLLKCSRPRNETLLQFSSWFMEGKHNRVQK